MNWIPLHSEQQLEEIKVKSTSRPQVIFKHSTRCSISAIAKSRLDKENAPATYDFYFLDLISYRNLSDKIAEFFKVYHESPQVLVIRNGACIYDESHMGISMKEIMTQAAW
ncbi:MAG TPA: bacillithiol system redox-active protein YtxJ [Flavitalea sp.]|nr:bacillithiol system redox-active protein YtxJ [Flavitalea sp.]